MCNFCTTELKHVIKSAWWWSRADIADFAMLRCFLTAWFWHSDVKTQDLDVGKTRAELSTSNYSHGSLQLSRLAALITARATVLCFYLHFLSLSFTERGRDIQYQRARWELSLSLCISSAFFLSLRVQRSRSNCVLRPRCGCGGSVFSSKGTSQVQV